MSADRHAKAKAIFLEACALAPERRAAFVAQACGGDESFRHEIERLLGHYLPPREPTTVVKLAGATDISEPPVFQTGDVVADRYRIVALLGKGAMGRVYRAEDDRLEQEVALKFLPRLQVLDPTWRRRVESEVRLGREVGHPNICRVYDLGNLEGAPYISMEYVDGEDLASLLRRVGRLTGTRAVDIARQICAGLAAAHIHGVLHRDLKPANVMIDQKGRVRITDFGLAVLAGQVSSREIRAGTPRYMAPEQIAGVAVTEKSDIYALGLVLYEMFTGRPAFDADNVLEYLRLHQSVDPPAPSTIVPEIDPKVEAVILACLRKDPTERPESALLVAAALPGGDLLAAALDAGQIPTREMVAQAAAQGRLSRRGTYRAAVGALGLFVAAIVIGNNTHPIARHGGVKAPEVLMERAHDVIRRAGRPPSPRQGEGQYVPAEDVVNSRIAATVDGAPLCLAIPERDELVFVYSEHRADGGPLGSDVLSFLMPGPRPRLFDAEANRKTTVVLDGQGRLLCLETPTQYTPTVSGQEMTADWSALVQTTGHDVHELVPTQPVAVGDFDRGQSRAFLSRSGEPLNRSVRIEAAGEHDRIQWLAVLDKAPSRSDSIFSSSSARWMFVMTLRNAVLLLLLAAALPAAWKNWKQRGDLAGAVRLGCFVFALRMLGHLLTMRNVGGLADAINSAAANAISALCEGMIVALFYMAIEAQVRRRWPRILGGWSRLLEGRVRDPFVGRDVLLGCAVGCFWAVLVFVDRQFPEWTGWEARTQMRLYQGFEDVFGARFAAAGILNSLRGGIYQGLVVLLLLLIGTWLAGARRWPALFFAWLIGAAMFAPAATHPLTAWTLFAFGIVGVALFVLLRWGLVSILAALLVVGFLTDFPVTFDLDAWFAGYSLFTLGATLGLILWGFYQASRLPSLENMRNSPPGLS
ncbi:MAG TPA: serine/threonine-protein kinase [Phycisphaerae bacterium]|nr:serine/threonine-protein kinase [Phycisphaerae bacterium]